MSVNIAIQTDDELICLYTQNMDRAIEICKKGNVEYIDIFEVTDEDMQYYCFDSRLYDPKNK